MGNEINIPIDKFSVDDFLLDGIKHWISTNPQFRENLRSLIVRMIREDELKPLRLELLDISPF